MSLTVTVQKGHDFSTGNVTRAALNAGATPTVAVTGSVTATEIAAGSITDAKLADDSVTQDKLKDDNSAGSANAAVTTHHIVDDAVTLAKLGPASVVGANILVNKDASNTNMIEGLADFPSEGVAVDDYVIVHDTSETEVGNPQLFRAKVSEIQKVGTTEYSTSGLSTTGVDPNFSVEVDMDGAPFQTITVTAGKTYTFSITNQPTSTVKTVTVAVTGAASGSANLAFTSGWRWPERVGDAGPSTIGSTEVALLSITAFGSDPANVMAAFAVTQA